MTGRWMMASIQTSFAVMPALVYLFAGHFAGTVSLGTVIAFTTLQARLFFPIGSLLGVGLEVQTSLALFDRVFEYLDQPVDIEPGTRTLERPAASPSKASGSATRTGPGRCGMSRSTPRGLQDGARRRDGLRQDDGGLPRRPPLRRHGRQGDDRRDRRARALLRVARERGRRRQPGDVPLPRERARQPPLRSLRRDRRGDRGRRARGADPRSHRRAAGWLRDRRRRAWLPLLRRRAAADRDRADDPAQPPILVLDEAVRSTPRPSRPCRRRSSGSRRVARRSRSPIGSRPSATPTRSSCARPRPRRRDRDARRAARGRRRYAALVSRDTEEILSS